MKGWKQSEHSSTLTVDQALVCRTISAVKSLRQESDARMGEVNPWRTFSVAFFRERFPADQSRTPTPIDGHRWNRSIYTISEPIDCRILVLVYLSACVFLRLILLNGGGLCNCNCNWRICSAPPTISPMAHYIVKLSCLRRSINESMSVTAPLKLRPYGAIQICLLLLL